jgi:hypothetical protein
MRLAHHLAILAFAFATFSCQNSVRVIDTPQPAGKIVIRFERVPASITHVVAALSREGFESVFLELTIADSGQAATGTFQDIAIGTWHLKVTAMDEADVVRFSGETDVTVLSGETAHADLVLEPATGNLEIHVSWGNVSNPDITTGLVLYFPFEGNTVDSSLNPNDVNNGSAINQVYVPDAWGNPNSAYLFNGVDNYITVDNSPSLNPTNQLTITMWMRIDSVTNNYPLLISKGAPQTEGFSNREYLVTWKDNFACPYLQIYSAGDSGGQNELIEESPCHQIGHWLFFGAVIDRQNHHMQLYIDGSLKQEVGDSYSTFNISSSPLLIGYTQEISADYGVFQGAMDNLRIYRRALTADQIHFLYTSHK